MISKYYEDIELEKLQTNFTNVVSLDSGDSHIVQNNLVDESSKK